MFETCRSVFCENRVFGSHKIPDLSSKKIGKNKSRRKKLRFFHSENDFPEFFLTGVCFSQLQNGLLIISESKWDTNRF